MFTHPVKGVNDTTDVHRALRSLPASRFYGPAWHRTCTYEPTWPTSP